MARILVCAATRAERDACKRGIARAVRTAGAEHELLLTGVGPLHAARALAERLSEGALPDLVVSSGFAGSLTSALALSSWVTATRLGEWVSGARVAVEGVAVEAFPGLVSCEVVSSSTLVSRTPPPGDETMPIAVDMESVALAREASRRGVAFTVVRLVSDTPEHPLPELLSPFTSALASTGTAARVGFAARGVLAALADPRGVRRLVVDGSTWLRGLEEGWSTFAGLRT